MFERFTERARQVVVLAHDEARLLRHSYIGTEHILLGLLREEQGLAGRVLDTLDITFDDVRAQVVRIVGQGTEICGGEIPFTPRVKKVLELALQEAIALDHNYIGTEHILLGLVRENGGVAARILLDLDAPAERIRDELLRMLSGPSRRDRGSIGKHQVFIPTEGGLARAKQQYDETHRLRLVVGCAQCAVPIEMVVTNQRNAHFQGSMHGNHTCAGCGRDWAITVSAAWTDPSPPIDPGDDLPSGMTVWRYPAPAQFSMFCFRCDHVLERVALDQPRTPPVHIEAEGDRTCDGCGKSWAISYAVSWDACTD